MTLPALLCALSLRCIGVLLALLLVMNDAHARDLQREIDHAAANGGGTVTLDPGRTLTIEGGIVLEQGVTLDLNGGTLVTRLDGPDVAGVRMLSHSVLRGGTVRVASRGYPGEQTGYHAAVLVGALYGENGDAAMSRFAAPSGWRIEGLTAVSDKWIIASDGPIGAAAIQVMGGASNGVIVRVRIPDNARMAGGIMLDWGYVGTVSSGQVIATQRAHDRGYGYTTHPSAITVRDVRIGRLTARRHGAPGTFGVRLSGVHDIEVVRVRIAGTSGAAVRHHAGDLGYRFARDHDYARAHRGIRIVDVRARISAGYALRSDTHADNLTRAFASPSIARTDMVITDFKARAVPGSNATGIRLDHQRGGTFAGIVLTGFAKALVIDEQVNDVAIGPVLAAQSTQAAFVIGHARRPPSDVTLAGFSARGSDPASRAGFVARSRNVSLVNLAGVDLRVADDALDLRRD